MYGIIRKLWSRTKDSAAPPPVTIRVVGVGGAGSNAIARMAASGLRGVEMVAMNTDVQALEKLRSLPTLVLGPRVAGGRGSGGSPEVGRRAARESLEEIGQALTGADMVFIAAGMGGGTGTGAAPLVAEAARRAGALTVAVVTLPFSFEGQHRARVARRGVEHLRPKVDTLIAVENDRLLPALQGHVSLERAFRAADEVLHQGVRGISELVTTPGLINVDFADVRTVMKEGDGAFMAVGEGRGPHAAKEALGAALSNPLFDGPISGARGLLLNVQGGQDLELGQVYQIVGYVKEAAGPQANLIFGVVQEPRWRQRVRVTLVATGISPRSEPSPSPKERDLLRDAATNGHGATTLETLGPRLL